VTAPVVLEPAPVDGTRATTTRGREAPRAIAWFGFSAFWGHMRHLVASAIATENVDSRKWMFPDEPRELAARILSIVEPDAAGAEGALDRPSLLQSLGHDLWIDYVADTGDDVTVSRAVARLVAAVYEVPGEGVLPRGDVLMLGGDTAYPVATVREITRRLLDPWNDVLKAADDGRTRVLLAIPGNHDWYDGLDGFARLCQAPCAFEGSVAADEALHPRMSAFPLLDWAEAFTKGEARRKPGAVALYGYVPVQRASYFRLPLGPGLEVFAVDRQLRQMDARQIAYFGYPRTRALALVMPDPARAWGEIRPSGAQVLRELSIDPAAAPTFVLSGDVHHYERSGEGPSVHVVAGGGGAFLHGARIAAGGAYPRTREFPGPKASARYLNQLPLFVATGRAGVLVTAVVAIANFVALRASFQHRHRDVALAIAAAIVLAFAVGTALLVGWRRHRMARVVPFAAATGLVIGALPIALGLVADRVAASALGVSLGGRLGSFVLAWAVATFASGFAFGAMLAGIARLGLNHSQPFAALGIPTYKHFVRLRARVSEGGDHTVIDAFVIGLVDPLAGDARPVLVDRFRFGTEGGAVEPS
jgi:hypothetical protein